MQQIQSNTAKSLRNVQTFLDANATLLAGVVGPDMRKRLDDAIAALSDHELEQGGSTAEARGSTTKHRALRTVLVRDHMAPIARIAHLELPRTPELSALRTPRGHPTIERLATAAYSMARVAQSHADLFIKAGLPTDFAARLEAVTDEMMASVQRRDASIGKVIGATSGVQNRITEARRLVHVIDAFVRTALKDNASLLANWNGVKRVPKTRGAAVVTPIPIVVTPASAAPVTPPPVRVAA